MTRLLLVDLLGCAFTNFHAKDNHLVSSFIKNIRDITAKFKFDAILLLKEGGSPYRSGLLPSYKAKRKERREKYTEAEKADYQKLLKQVTEISDTLELLGVKSLRHIGAEADDLAGYLCAALPPEEYQICLLSEDSDWTSLLVRKNTVQGSYKAMSKAIDSLDSGFWLSYNSYTKVKGMTPIQAYEAKLLCGDTSDSIPGIDGLGATGAENLIKHYGSLQEVLNNRHNIVVKRITAKAKEGLLNAEPILDMGHKLMNLRWTVEEWKEILGDVEQSVCDLAGTAPQNIEAFKELCYERGWLAFVDEDFLEPFLEKFCLNENNY